MKLNALILFKNHKKYLERLIDSLQFCDAIYACDSGATDGSKEYLESRGVKMFYRKWSDDFGEQYEYLRSKMPLNEWIFRIDVDELPTKTLQQTAKLSIDNFLPDKDSDKIETVWCPYANLVQDEQHYDANSFVEQARIFLNTEKCHFVSINKVHPVLDRYPYGIRLGASQAMVHLAALHDNIPEKRKYYKKIGGQDSIDGYNLMYPEAYDIKPLPNFIVI